MSLFRYLIILFAGLLLSSGLKAQLTVQDVLTDQELVQQVLLGDGVQVYNITSTGAAQAIGEFDTGAGGAEIPMSSGIIMSTGSIYDVPGPNNSNGTSSNLGRPGDTDLQNIIGINTNDAAVIEFDFKSPADTVRFNYIFASEEYREYVCDFNDAFAFLLTGPNPAGGNYTNYNIALVPGTTTEVAIKTVNNGDPNSTCPEENSNSAYYVDNGNGSTPVINSFVEFDGLTDVFTAEAVVIPCQEYHIKLVVADALDAAYDSGVFLEANSFGANVDTLIADFVHNAPQCTENDVQFLNAGPSGNGVSYQWTFGGDASIPSSIDENPAVNWATPGLKQVDLKIIINCGMDSASVRKYVNIYERPDADFTFANNVCGGTTVDFINTGSTGTEYSHQWIFTTDAQPVEAFTENPQVVFMTPGDKPVQHIVSNDHCSMVHYDTITILGQPLADFSHTAPVCNGQLVDFTNTGTSAGVSYSWSFAPDATPAVSSVENPAGISFATSGTKTASLTVTDLGSGCQHTAQQDFQILEVPVADFNFVNNVCVGTGVDFVNAGSSGSEYTYSWDFGSSASIAGSNAENPQNVSFDSDGVHIVSLTVSNGSCSDAMEQTITIENSPAPEVTFSSNAPQCAGDAVDFAFDGDPTGLTFNWDFGTDATPLTSTDANPSGIVFANGGSYIIDLTVTDAVSGCWNSVRQTINVSDNPIASFSFADSVCIGAQIDFANTGSAGSEFTYTWDFGADATPASSTVENPQSVSYSSSGMKIISLTVASPNCVESFMDTLYIQNSPAPVIDFTSTAPQCEANEVNFAVVDFDSGLNYSWDFGSDALPAVSVDAEPVVMFNASGIHNVVLTAVDPVSGCSNTAEKPVNIHARPMADFTSNAPVCMGEGVEFLNAGSTGAEFSYSWDFGQDAEPAVSNAENPGMVMYSSAGQKNVSLTVSSANCTRTFSQTITISETPLADFESNAPQCSGKAVSMHNMSSIDDVSYAWYFGSGASPETSTDFEPVVVYPTAGTYEIRLVVTNNTTSCQDSISEYITIHETPDAAFSSNAPLCPGETVSFVNEGSTGQDYTYTWSFGRNAIPSGSQSENPTGIVFADGGEQTICLSVSNNFCTQSIYGSIDMHALPIADAGIDTIICANRSVVLGTPAQADHVYSWLPATVLDNATAAQPLASPQAEFTTFHLLVTDVNTSCTNTDSVNVTMMPPAIANAGSDVAICAFDSVQIGVGYIEGQTYVWTPETGLSDATASNPMVSPEESTVYTLSVSYGGCDFVTDEVTVTVNPLPEIEAGDDVVIARGEETRLSATGGVNYNWSPVVDMDNPYIATPVVSPDDTITYTVVGNDIHGCTSSDSVTVMVKEPDFFIPNSFTPNNDGQNDVFYVRGNPISDFSLQILNRQNQPVFISTDYYTGWDGTVQNSGEKCPQGAYVYIVTGVNEQGEAVSETGMVNLIR